MQINKIDSIRLRNDAYFQYRTEFRDLVLRSEAVLARIKPQFDAYELLYTQVDDAFKKINKSIFTEQIQEADKARIKVYTGLTAKCRAALKHFDPKIQEAAKHVKIVFDTYGSIARKPLNEKTSAIHNILQELKGKYAKDVALIGVSEWTKELRERNNAFDALMKKRFDESAGKNDVVLREARKELDKKYRLIIERINALIIVDGTENYEKFVRTLNIITRKYAGGKAGKSLDMKTVACVTRASTPSTPSTGSGTGSGDDYDCIIIPPPNNNDIPLWSAGEHFSQMKIGDKRRTADGRVWELIDLGQAHRDPAGEFGHFGWRLVV